MSSPHCTMHLCIYYVYACASCAARWECVHGSVSEVNCSGAYAQVISCHLSSHCWRLNHLLFIWTHSLPCCRLLPSKSSVIMVPWTACTRKKCKLCVKPNMSIVDPLQTDIQAQPQTKTLLMSLLLRPLSLIFRERKKLKERKGKWRDEEVSTYNTSKSVKYLLLLFPCSVR